METLRIDGYIGEDSGLAALLGDGTSFNLRKLESILDSSSDNSLKIKINSGGGSVVEGFAIHDRLVTSGKEIETEVLGMCGSIATIIALSAPKGKRRGHSNSEYFIHNPFWQPMAPDPMEADDLARLATELRDAEDRILDFYVEKTGAKRAELKKLMEQKTSLSMQDAKRLGFIDEIITESVAEKKYAILAYVDNKSKNTEMDANQKTFLDKLDAKVESMLTKFNSMFKPLFMMFIDLDNGGKIFIDTQDEKELKGMKAFNVDAEGNKTINPVPDGEYLAKDGRTLVVAAGTVTDVKDKQPDETTALKSQIAELTTKLEQANQKANTVQTEKTALETSVTAMKSEILEFKNMILTKDIPGAEQQFKGDSPQMKSANQAWLDLKRAKQAEKEKSLKPSTK